MDVSIDSIVPLPVSHEKKLGERDDIKTYQVRFSQSLLDAEGKPVSDIGQQLKLDADGKPIAEPKRVYWTAIISFDYRNAPLTEGDGWVNPKGFGVLAYSKTQEIREGDDHFSQGVLALSLMAVLLPNASAEIAGKDLRMMGESRQLFTARITFFVSTQ